MLWRIEVYTKTDILFIKLSKSKNNKKHMDIKAQSAKCINTKYASPCEQANYRTRT